MNNDDLARSNSRPNVPLIQIPAATRFPDDRRQPIKHVLIGSPAAVRITQHTLHVLRYADMNDWAEPLSLDEAFVIVPNPGDVISVLVRYLAIE